MKAKEFDESLDRILGFFYQIDSKAKQELETDQSKYIHQDPNLNSHPKQYDSNLDIPEEKSLYRTSNI
jgi:hypothetical protein